MHHAISPADVLVSGSEAPTWITITMGVLAGACVGALIAGGIVLATMVGA